MLFLMLCTKTEAGFTLVMFGLLALWLRQRWYFAVFPLVMFTTSKAKMGALVAPRWLAALAYLIALAIAALNVKLLLDVVSG